MAEPYPPPSISGFASASRATVEEDAPLLLLMLDEDPSLPIFTRSTPGFEDIRKIANKNITTQPLAITRPTTVAQVSLVIRSCVGHSPRIPLAIRAGGHHFWDRNLIEDGLVLDLRGLNQVEVAEDRTFARVGGGILGGVLAKELESVGLTTPTGFCTSVGYAGWALGGGYGILQGKYGLGCDQILSARLVTSSGQVFDTKDDPELLWALRGAGNGNFGAVVELTIKVYPCPAMLAGNVCYSMTEAKSVFANFQQLLAEDFPDEFSGDFLSGHVPGLGLTIIMIFSWTQEDGNLTKAFAYLERFKKIGNVVMDTVTETTPSEYASFRDPMTAIQLHYCFRTVTVSGITPELVELFQGIEKPPGPGHIIAHNAHGAAIEPDSASCFANRMPHIVLGISGAPPPPIGAGTPEMEAANKYVDDLADAINNRGLALDRAYMNFSHPNEFDTERFYGREATKRLTALKEKYDGENIFFKAYPPLDPTSQP